MSPATTAPIASAGHTPRAPSASGEDCAPRLNRISAIASSSSQPAKITSMSRCTDVKTASNAEAWFDAAGRSHRSMRLDKVEPRDDRQPHQIDENPIAARRLGAREPALALLLAHPERRSREPAGEQRAAENVRGMHPGNREPARPQYVRRR